jgi:hypothetical protein
LRREDKHGLESLTIPEIELQLLSDAHTRDGALEDDARRTYTLTPVERSRRLADEALGDWLREDESNLQWDLRVLAAREQRGEDIGNYLRGALSFDDEYDYGAYGDLATHPLANYGEHPGDFGYGMPDSEGCHLHGWDDDPVDDAVYFANAADWMCAACLRARVRRPAGCVTCDACRANIRLREREREKEREGRRVSHERCAHACCRPKTGGATIYDDFDDLIAPPYKRGVHYGQTASAGDCSHRPPLPITTPCREGVAVARARSFLPGRRDVMFPSPRTFPLPPTGPRYGPREQKLYRLYCTVLPGSPEWCTPRSSIAQNLRRGETGDAYIDWAEEAIALGTDVDLEAYASTGALPGWVREAFDRGCTGYIPHPTRPGSIACARVTTKTSSYYQDIECSKCSATCWCELADEWAALVVRGPRRTSSSSAPPADNGCVPGRPSA